MRVIWDDYAEMKHDQIAEYIRERFGTDRRKKFLQEVRRTTGMLKQYSNLGILEPLFHDRQRTYRSIIIGGLSKLVYFVDNDIIYISSMWDCRQDPESQAAQMKEDK